MSRTCNLCNFRCGVDRSIHTGRCGIDDSVYISHYGLHRGEEPFLTGEHGSGTIFFSGCTLRCRFCQNFQISRWKVSDGYSGIETVSIDRLVEIFRELEQRGASNINFVSPTPYVPSIREAVLKAKNTGFSLPFVYNTHGYDTAESIELLSGVIDIYLPDLKYGDDDLGKKLSGAPGLYTYGKECIRSMYGQKGLLSFGADSVARSGIAVRHLVLPQYIENSFEVLDFLASVDRNIRISLMSQYHPVRTDIEFPWLNRTLEPGEYERILDYAYGLGLKNILVQELESHNSYLPDFDREVVFEE